MLPIDTPNKSDEHYRYQLLGTIPRNEMRVSIVITTPTNQPGTRGYID